MKPAYDGKRLVRLQTRDVTKYRVGQQVLNKGREKNLNGLVVDVCVSEHRAGDENGEGRMGRVTIAPYGDEWQGGPEAEDVEESSTRIAGGRIVVVISRCDPQSTARTICQLQSWAQGRNGKGRS